MASATSCASAAAVNTDGSYPKHCTGPETKDVAAGFEYNNVSLWRCESKCFRLYRHMHVVLSADHTEALPCIWVGSVPSRVFGGNCRHSVQSIDYPLEGK